MALTPEEVTRFEARAREVGDGIGRELQFRVAPNPEYVTLTAAPTQTTIVGPSRLSDGAAEAIADVLDRLESGVLLVATDEDGDPFITARVDLAAATSQDLTSAFRPAFAEASEGRLDLQRLLDIVGDATQAVLLGEHPEVAAIKIIAARAPTARELAAAREQSQESLSGLTPEPLRSLMPPKPVDGEIVRLRRMVDDVLVATSTGSPTSRAVSGLAGRHPSWGLTVHTTAPRRTHADRRTGHCEPIVVRNMTDSCAAVRQEIELLALTGRIRVVVATQRGSKPTSRGERASRGDCLSGPSSGRRE